MRFTVFSPVSFALFSISAWHMVGVLAESRVQLDSLSRRQADFDPAILGGCEGACSVFNGTYNNPECTTYECLCTQDALAGLDNCAKCLEENSPSAEFIADFKDFSESYKADVCSPENASSASAPTGSPGASTTSNTPTAAPTTSISTASSTGTGVPVAQTTTSQSSSTGTPGNSGSTVRGGLQWSVTGIVSVALALSL